MLRHWPVVEARYDPNIQDPDSTVSSLQTMGPYEADRQQSRANFSFSTAMASVSSIQRLGGYVESGRRLLQSSSDAFSDYYIKQGSTVITHEVVVTTDTSFMSTPGYVVVPSNQDIMIQVGGCGVC